MASDISSQYGDSCSYVKLGSFIFLSWGCNSFLYILDASLLSDIYCENIFLLLCGPFSYVLTQLFKQRVYLINKIYFLYLFLHVFYIWRKLYLHGVTKTFLFILFRVSSLRFYM